MCSTRLQIAGLVLGVIGLIGVLAALVMDQWCNMSQNQQQSGKQIVQNYKGLWRDCEVSSGGLADCQPIYSHQDYTGQFHAVRALMVLATVLGLVAVLVLTFSFKCIKIACMETLTRANLMLSAGIIFIIAAICAIAGASLYAAQVANGFTTTQQDDNLKQGQKGDIGQFGNAFCNGGTQTFMSSCTLGPALYIAWIGGGLLILGGILLCIAYRKALQTTEDVRDTYVYKAPGPCMTVDEECQLQRCQDN